MSLTTDAIWSTIQSPTQQKIQGDKRLKQICILFKANKIHINLIIIDKKLL